MTETPAEPNDLRGIVLRFVATGILVTALHFVVAVAFIEWIAHEPAMANGIAFLIATAAAYLLHTLWSFKKPLSGSTLRRFLIVTAIGLLLAMGVSGAVDWLGLHYLLGICAVAVTVPVATFLLHHGWTYRN